MSSNNDFKPGLEGVVAVETEIMEPDREGGSLRYRGVDVEPLADGKTDVVPDDVVSRGKTAAEKFLLRWRGEADPRHVKAIDTYWICTAEHGLNASTFTARVVASTGADCGAALSSAVG